MKGTKKTFSIGRLVKRVLLVTAVLAVIEVVIIYFIMNDKAEKVVENKVVASATEPVGAITANKTNEPRLTDTVTATTNNEAEKRLETTALIKVDTVVPPVAPTKQAEVAAQTQQLAAKEKLATKPATPPIEKTVEVNLSTQQMVDIFEKVNAALGSRDTKCIQIRKSKNSNVKNAFEIGNYLKTKGFIISGRELTSKNNKGVLVDASGACIKLTIGEMRGE